MTPLPPPCPPCVDSTRLHMSVQNVPVCTGTTRTCFNTCARGAGMHGDVSNVHTEAFLNPHTGFSRFFSVPQHTNTHTHQTHTTTTNNTTTTTTHTTQHNTQHHTETEKETRYEKTRERETEKETQDKKTREDDTREDERRETRQEKRLDEEERK